MLHSDDAGVSAVHVSRRATDAREVAVGEASGPASSDV